MAIDLSNAQQANTLARQVVRNAKMYDDLVKSNAAFNAALTSEGVVAAFGQFEGSSIGTTAIPKATLGAAGVALMNLATALNSLSAGDKAAIAALLNNYGAQAYLG